VLQATSLVALIKQRLGVDAVVQPGKSGQFDVVVDNNRIAWRGGNIATRILFGAGFPDLEGVVDELEKRAAASARSA
jgi:hypothetical protein